MCDTPSVFRSVILALALTAATARRPTGRLASTSPSLPPGDVERCAPMTPELPVLTQQQAPADLGP